MFVVVINEFAQDSLELASMKNQHRVEALTSNRACEALGERIRTRGLKGRADDQDPLGSEHLIETRAELGIAFPNQELPSVSLLSQGEAQIASLLSDPLPHRIGGDADEGDPRGIDLDEEQHVETFEQDGVDGEEVRRKHCRSPGSQELVPAGATSSRRWIDAVTFEYRPDARSSETHAHRRQFPVNPSIPQGRILPCQT
jgi:hypothetical protein